MKTDKRITNLEIRVETLENKIKMLECEHEEFDYFYRGDVLTISNLGEKSYPIKKQCKNCGKVFFVEMEEYKEYREAQIKREIEELKNL